MLCMVGTLSAPEADDLGEDAWLIDLNLVKCCALSIHVTHAYCEVSAIVKHHGM